MAMHKKIAVRSGLSLLCNGLSGLICRSRTIDQPTSYKENMANRQVQCWSKVPHINFMHFLLPPLGRGADFEIGQNMNKPLSKFIPLLQGGYKKILI